MVEHATENVTTKHIFLMWLKERLSNDRRKVKTTDKKGTTEGNTKFTKGTAEAIKCSAKDVIQRKSLKHINPRHFPTPKECPMLQSDLGSSR